MFSEKSKYQRWYDGLMHSRKLRDTPIAYAEVHHILPRALGGGDGDYNLVRLSYREHFIAHWLLTKFLGGKDLRKMRRALWAMTMPANGRRIIAGWQYEVAKRALFTEECVARAEAKARAEHVKKNHRLVKETNRARLQEAMKLLVLPEEPLLSRVSIDAMIAKERGEAVRRKRPSKRVRKRARAGKRIRAAIAAEHAAALPC